MRQMNFTAKILLAIAMLAAHSANAADGVRLSAGSLRGEKLKSPSIAPSARVDYDLKKVGSRQRASQTPTVAPEQAKGRAKQGNRGRRLNIRAFCGKRFGEKDALGRSEAIVQSEKKYFGGYSTLKLKYSPSLGLYSIAAINRDPSAIRDVETEMKRVMRELMRTYEFRFTSAVERTDNGIAPPEQAEIEQCEVPEVEEVLARYHDMQATLQKLAAKQKPATRWETRISEEFSNCRISVLGIRDADKDLVSVEVTIELFKP